jgi:hypothetical protein
MKIFTRDEILEKVTPRVCYMGNVKTLDSFDGLMAAERYIRKNNLNISTSFSNKSFEKPSGKILDCGYTYEITEDDIKAYSEGVQYLKDKNVIRPFVEKPTELESLTFSLYSKVTYKVLNNMPLHKYEENFLHEKSEFVRKGILKLGGWLFNLNSYLKTFWVKDNEGSISEYKAINLKLLKKYLKEYESMTVSRIKIVEIGA